MKAWKRCGDAQTSADAQRARLGLPGGAMTTAFGEICRENKGRSYGVSYGVLLSQLHKKLQDKKFTQKPVLTSSQPFDIKRRFVIDSIGMNCNPVLGQIVRKKFKPQKPSKPGPGSPVSGMLLAMFTAYG